MQPNKWVAVYYSFPRTLEWHLEQRQSTILSPFICMLEEPILLIAPKSRSLVRQAAILEAFFSPSCRQSPFNIHALTHFINGEAFFCRVFPPSLPAAVQYLMGPPVRFSWLIPSLTSPSHAAPLHADDSLTTDSWMLHTWTHLRSKRLAEVTYSYTVMSSIFAL